MKFIYFLAFNLIFIISLNAQSIEGVWKTIDDKTNEEKSYIDIKVVNGIASGNISKLLLSPPDTKCKKCKGKKKNQALVGMEIISKLSKDKDEWNGGKILDPETGKTYKCSIWLDNGNLKVRGKHWTGIYRTQTWYRVK